MRASLLISVSSAAVFAASIAVARQDQAVLAEQQFKNIQVLKGQKASDIIPAMQFMSAALHVNCDYCHTQDRSSDDKREKESARKMILMTKQINDTNFNGRTEITCATCHAGHTHPIPFPPAPGVETRLRNDRTLSADTILSNYDTAVGGSKAASLPALRLAGDTSNDGKPAKMEVVYLGNKYVVTRTAVDHPDQPQKIGYDGTQGWYTNGPQSNMIPAEVMSGFIHEQALYTGKASLPALQNSQAGTTQIDGKDIVGVRGALDGGVQATYFFDKKSNLLVRTSFFTPTIMGRIPLICDYSDYKKVDGVLIPTHIVVHSDEGEEDFRVKDVHTDSKVDPAIFGMPKK